MALFDFSKLKKLPPNMRIQALNKLEEQLTKLIQQRQKEIEEAQQLLQEAKHELEVIEDIETPKIKKVEVEKLFEKKEEKTFEEKTNLEKIAGGAPRMPAEQESYAKFMAERMSMDQIYNRLTDIRQEQTQTGIETRYQQNFVDAAERALYFKRQFEAEGKYNPSEKAEHLLTSSEKLIKYLKGDQ